MTHPAVLDTDPSTLEGLFAAQLPTTLRLRGSTAADRLVRLKKFREELLARREAFYQAFAQDFRKPPAEVEVSEFLPVVDEVRHAVSQLRSWMRPKRVGATLTSLGTSSSIQFQPRGRCLILGPWNYPLNTLLCPLISAVAAGNTVMLKPSELTPAVGRVIADLVAAVFPSDEVAVVLGGVATAKHLLELPFDHVFFTGSPNIGKEVMAAASRHLASVTLELGGKSPTIVDESASLARAAEVLVWGKMINIGQSCVAPDYVFVHRSVHKAFIQHCERVIKERYGDVASQRESSADLARIISVRHTDRIAGLLADARAQGAEVVIGGDVNVEGRYIGPTILSNVPLSSNILREEIFGPVLPVLVYDDLDEVIKHINLHPKPLALYIWSQRSEVVDKVLQRTSSGGVCVNHCMLQYVHNGLPFGGVNNSGIGNSHGYFGFRTFSHERAVLRGGAIMMASMMFPPYTPSRIKLIRFMINALSKL